MLPPFLKPGDTIGICAPARKVSREEMASGIEFMQSKGFKVKESENLYSELNQFSGNDIQRADDFQTFLDNPEIKAIISARGGYGCVRIIDKLDFSGFKKNPKWIIGFSDLTVFHSHLLKHFGIATLHAPMVYSMASERRNEEAADNIFRILTGEAIRYSITCEKPLAELNRNGKAKGKLIGGNLSLIYALSGSASDIDTSGKILFLEDLDEYRYHIDRMMMQLKRGGKLDRLKALIIGGMNDMRDNTTPFGKTAEEIIAEHVEEYNYPVCYGFPAGHISRNLPLILGEEISFEVNDGEVILESIRA